MRDLESVLSTYFEKVQLTKEAKEAESESLHFLKEKLLQDGMAEYLTVDVRKLRRYLHWPEKEQR